MGHIIGVDTRGLSCNPLIEALAVFTFPVIAAKLAEWGLRVKAPRLGQWTHAELGEQVIEMVPISVISNSKVVNESMERK